MGTITVVILERGKLPYKNILSFTKLFIYHVNEYSSDCFQCKWDLERIKMIESEHGWQPKKPMS